MNIKWIIGLALVVGAIYYGVQWAGKGFDSTNQSLQEEQYRKERFKNGPAASGSGIDPAIKKKVDKEFAATEAAQDKVAKQMNPYKGATPAPAPATAAAPASPSNPGGSGTVVSTGSGTMSIGSPGGDGGAPAVSSAKMRARVDAAYGGGAARPPAPARPGGAPPGGAGAGATTHMGDGAAAVNNSDFSARMNRMVEATGKPNEVKVTRTLSAYDPATPGRVIGQFQPDSLLTLGEKDATSGMVPVTFTNPDGSQVHAVCKADEVGR